MRKLRPVFASPKIRAQRGQFVAYALIERQVIDEAAHPGQSPEGLDVPIEVDALFLRQVNVVLRQDITLRVSEVVGKPIPSDPLLDHSDRCLEVDLKQGVQDQGTANDGTKFTRLGLSIEHRQPISDLAAVTSDDRFGFALHVIGDYGCHRNNLQPLGVISRL
jgi:hypothetical protein